MKLDPPIEQQRDEDTKQSAEKTAQASSSSLLRPFVVHSRSVAIEAGSELLLLPDGRVLAHHLTPELAAVLNAVTSQ